MWVINVFKCIKMIPFFNWIIKYDIKKKKEYLDQSANFFFHFN